MCDIWQVLDGLVSQLKLLPQDAQYMYHVPASSVVALDKPLVSQVRCCDDRCCMNASATTIEVL